MTESQVLSPLEYEKHGVSGVVIGQIEWRDQDEYAEPAEMYVVSFFPKIRSIGMARLGLPDTQHTMSFSPEAAIAKFMDRHPSVDQTWDQYVASGWKVRKVKITDLGDPNETAD